MTSFDCPSTSTKEALSNALIVRAVIGQLYEQTAALCSRPYLAAARANACGKPLLPQYSPSRQFYNSLLLDVKNLSLMPRNRRLPIIKKMNPVDFQSVTTFNQALRTSLLRVSVDTMAITALPLDCWLKERLKNWVQLSGHEGTIVPATDQTLWKRRSCTDYNEALAYEKLMKDDVCPLVPRFYKEIEYKGESFIEIEDLTSHFTKPAIMDIKLGIRTFAEAEVENPKKRSDLYQKMTKIDPSEPTDLEHIDGAITKLRYMQFRERESSTAELGFRIEAAKMPGGKLQKHFQKVRTREQVMLTLWNFFGPRAPSVRDQILKRLHEMRDRVTTSDFFRTHEVVGSSLLFMYDENKASAWMIDFAKSQPILDGKSVDHRSAWKMGNHEDGYLLGLDNLIQILEDSRTRNLSISSLSIV